MNRGLFLFLATAAALLNSTPVRAATDKPESTVVATVGDDPITLADVKRTMESVPADKRSLPLAQAIALEETVNRWLVIAYGRRAGDVPSDEALAKAKKQLQIRLAARGQKAGDVPTAAELERQALWRLTWDRYLAKYRTPERRAAWFRAHHRDVDGTQLAVSHILLQPVHKDDATEIETLIKRAAEIRTEIASGTIDFAQAAAKYSAGPSGKQGGRLGKIGRHGPMDESFSTAAFALDAGQISPPVRSPFGVHLIRCDEVVPGTKKIADVRETIDAALASELLLKISSIERGRAEVKYTDAWPHFKPGTQELAK
jgi:parvulin-like peptidyl-prolyl isomerase